MKIIGLMKVRNEEIILQETLDHWGKICTGGIYVYDDKSTDSTVQICKNHKAVKAVIEGEVWDPDRETAEWQNRQAVLTRAQQDADPTDWFIYFDADERLYFNDWNLLFNPQVDAIACKLWDIYITPEDVDKPYLEREWVGPEYRTIVMFFRNQYGIGYDKPDQRITNLPAGAKVLLFGDVKHFGKGLSVKHWEETCRYYIDHWPKYAAKWEQRLGKAVKSDFKSDFGNPLVKWNQKELKGFPLENQIYGRN